MHHPVMVADLCHFEREVAENNSGCGGYIKEESTPFAIRYGLHSPPH